MYFRRYSAVSTFKSISRIAASVLKAGDRYLRTMMVQGAHYILGPFGEDSDLRRWGRKLSERGGKNAKTDME
jgi:hypothetical protein